AANRQRYADPDQGFVQRAAYGGSDVARRWYISAGPHERHPGRALAFPCHGIAARPAVHPVAYGQQGPVAGAALGARDLSSARRAAWSFPRSVLFLRRWAPGHAAWPAQVSADDRAQPPAAPSACLSASGRGRKRRPRVLGFAVSSDGEALWRVAGG